MANINPTMNIRVGTGAGEDDLSLQLATWTNLNGANNVGTAIIMPQHSDRCVQITGCFNAATVVIEGSNDGTTYANLTAPDGSAASFTAPGIKQLVEVPLYVRPNMPVNNIASDVSVKMLLRRNVPLTR